jgi:hypothetical protein
MNDNLMNSSLLNTRVGTKTEGNTMNRATSDTDSPGKLSQTREISIKTKSVFDLYSSLLLVIAKLVTVFEIFDSEDLAVA